ncbi:SsrA-binding protein SmpB [Buchnera aphidicola]|uniref:SsrA-binding protein n=1 Tax=Buchnera aphidicola str. USDA (Myzus persicae) TaxID=1009856 RepID=W0P037_BUCMP|nr:SsrA-binding protein SmpB [Buchnera aphidicola]AHG60126.1 Smpb [Buchnera aphidicola str. USDA (Myzus persicae)]AHG60706.1 Smpb [Buchnera aphidicola str. W106 (Myzus persicae)]AHG61278.1 Smpb [Buchnera aphidicola str. G002 (Myzus persicae)]AHG61851.1 Smpb [Buchnera aphidicola str. F009 (Myzus persicae)]WAI03184.1 MAG: SsrA-binding protein SmpB [Buchnera aphidicola (Myzus persicae)]
MLHKKNRVNLSKIVINKKAYHNYSVEKIFESGLVLEGWEVKSIRSGKINISESYVINYLNEMYLYNALIQPLNVSSNNNYCNPMRKRKLLLHKNEINFLSIQRKNIGYTLIPLSLFWKKSWCKLEFGLAKGKNMKDKRTDAKNKEWQKEKLKILKKTNTNI